VQDIRRSATMIFAVAATVCSAGLAGASSAAAGTRIADGARAAAVGGTWGTAIEVPGTAALNQGGNAQINSLSCASAGTCSAGGFYTDSSGRWQALVAGETNGTWHAAIEVPSTAALNQGGQAMVNSVSCASAGNCSAGGLYRDGSGHNQAFVAGERDGTWHTAIEVPGTAALNQRGDAQIVSVSCASAGNCSAGGTYQDGSGHDQAFVAGETNGTWHRAVEVPGTAALNKKGFAGVSSVSCSSAGSCSAGGFYTGGSGLQQALVADETNGTWHSAIAVPGTVALNKNGGAAVNEVSCGSAGNCSAGGTYSDSAGRIQAFVAGETNGTWHTAKEVPGTAVLNQGGNAQVNSVSCGSAGNCSAGGFYTDSAVHSQAFVVGETNGTWRTAKEVPGTAALNQGPAGAQVVSLSCASAGNCSAGGLYTDSANHSQVFVASETNGTWRTAIEVPGTAALNQRGDDWISSVSCASAGHCSAGGYYTPSEFLREAFVVNET
jgi:hypothetical protein